MRCLLLALCLHPSLNGTLLSAQTRPNIIFLMADDMGYGDLSCFGSKSNRTPNLDRIAAEGIRFTQAYAAGPLCTPSRTAFMTGRYPARTPVGIKEPLDWTKEDSLTGLSPDFPTLPALLKTAGYRTALIGKWHLGFVPAFSPQANGFDYFFGYHGGAVDYISHTDPHGRPDLYLNDRQEVRKGYLTDLLADEAVRFLANKESSPFFLSVQFSAPHWPWQIRGSWPSPLGNKEWKEGGSKAVYSEMVRVMDEAVGRIMRALDSLKLSDNTLVIFTSDNGGEKYSDMGGLKGRKFELWEGGIRVPAILRWPGKIRAGEVSDQPLIHMDWTATILTVAGVRAHPDFPLDGQDALRGLRETGGLGSRTFYWRVSRHGKKQAAIREGDWKFLKVEKEEYLFNLADDPFEQKSLSRANAAVRKELREKLAAWENSVLSPLPSHRCP